ncbi:MAG: DsbE family thiol:disulfide interchange protein, partial [Pseudomonadota bacterium]
FVLLAGFAVRGLGLDQTKQPSNLIDKPAPAFELVDMPGLGNAFDTAELTGQVTLVNVFGSWCAGCRLEHDLLMAIGAEDEVPLYGINWADTPERGAEWLARYGNPYDRVGNDETGRNIIELGVTGAPETFVIDREGRIRYRHVGPLTLDTWQKTLRPMVLELQTYRAPES